MDEKRDSWLYDIAIRGYVDPTGLYAYSGPDFELTGSGLEQFSNNFRSLVRVLSLTPDLKVYAGVIPGRPGTRWPGRVLLGTVGELLNG